MTTLVAWVASNLGRPNAVYMASDSRITWGGHNRRWDAGRKLFASRVSPDIFGYCGEVLFASQVLGQITDLVDHGLLYSSATRVAKRHAGVVSAIQASHARRHHAPEHDFQIVHIGREGRGPTSTFHAWVTAYSARRDAWHDESMALAPTQPMALGSGSAALIKRVGGQKTNREQEANRALFIAFCQSLVAEADPLSGGVPQLVGLYQARPAQSLGIVHAGQRFLHGLPAGAIHFGRLEWRDCEFRPIDGRSMKPKRLLQAQQRSRTVRPWR